MKQIIILLMAMAFASCSQGPIISSTQETASIIEATTTTPVHRNDIDWWRERHQGVLDHVKQGNVDVLMIGDSITHAWPDRALASWNNVVKNWNAVNMGYSGDRTEHLLWRLQNGEVDNISPKVAVLMIGTNNTGHNMDPAMETANGVKTVISELRNRLPNTKILLLAIFPRGETADHPMRLLNDEINKELFKMADFKNIYYLDLTKDFLEDDGALSPEIMPDYLHPNEAGYDIWASVLGPMLTVLMSE